MSTSNQCCEQSCEQSYETSIKQKVSDCNTHWNCLHELFLNSSSDLRVVDSHETSI